MKKLLLLSCIIAASPALAEKTFQKENESGSDMIQRGLNDIKFALNEGKNGTASIFCQHKSIPKFKDIYLNNTNFVLNTLIEDPIFKAQFNEIYSSHQIEPDYKYSFFQYKDTALEFFQYPETALAFCDLPEFRSQLDMLLQRVNYLAEFNNK